MDSITVAFFGISGSGKGTQVDMLEKYLKDTDSSRGIVKPGMGDLLREFMQTNTPTSVHIGDIIKAGGLVPSFMPIYLMTKAVNETFDGTQHVILEGTCRRPDQSRAANDMMRMFGRNELSAVVLTLTKDSAKKRLVARGRFDDAQDEAIESRFAWYQEHVVPAIEELRACGWTVHEIDGEPDVDTIHKNILGALKLS